MKNIKTCSNSFVLILFLFLLTGWLSIEAEANNGKNHHHPNKPKDCNHIFPKCSEEVPHGGTKAILTLNSFQNGGDGGGPSECDGKFHSNNIPLVALPSRWFEHRKRCFHHITINGNGRTVKATVIDECDSKGGCKENIVDASPAVWKALGVPKKNWGEMSITWSDA